MKIEFNIVFGLPIVNFRFMTDDNFFDHFGFIGISALHVVGFY
jgi:hypothetical protein